MDSSQSAIPVPVRPKRPLLIGWREFVSLPQWGVEGVEAKVDTGARTSAVHVEDVKRLKGNRVFFHLVVSRKRPFVHVPVKADVLRVTRVRSSSGHVQERFVVATEVRIGPVLKRVELSLVRRDKMLCRMLLGRTALDGFLIDAGRRYELGRRPRPRRIPKVEKRTSKVE